MTKSSVCVLSTAPPERGSRRVQLQKQDGIGPEPAKLATYALIHAKGQGTLSNGIVLLYGAGQVWPHVLGDFRLPVPSAFFAKYLTPQWRAAFIPD